LVICVLKKLDILKEFKQNFTLYLEMQIIVKQCCCLGFSATGTLGSTFSANVKVMDMTGFAKVDPYGTVVVSGQLKVGSFLHGTLKLEGSMIEVGFPSKAELSFSKFPLEVG
jgi:hypothetical protein